MEARTNYGFPSMTCDYCNKPITNDDSLVVDGSLTYHGECFLELTDKFPTVIKGGD